MKSSRVVMLMLLMLMLVFLLLSCGEDKNTEISLNTDDAVSDTESETQTDIQTQMQTDIQTETQTQIQTETQAEPPADTQTEMASDIQTDTTTDIQTETLPPPPDVTKAPEVTIDTDSLSELQSRALDWCKGIYDAAVRGQTVSADAQAAELSERWSESYSVISREMHRYYVKYNNGDMNYDSFERLMGSFSSVPSAKGLAEGYVKLAQSKRQDIDHIEKAKGYVSTGKFMQSAISISKISGQQDSAVENAVREFVSANIENFKLGVTEAVTQYMVRYELSEGRAFLEALRGYGLDDYINGQCTRLENYRKYQEDELEEVSVLSTLENVYTHCLIAFPEINFASQSTYGACGSDCLTPDELRFLLESLYQRGYIIIDANIIYDKQNDTFFRTIKLPKGKKPLILTFDDVTYDSRKMGRGMVDKLIVDEDGYVCTYTRHSDGSEVISYDNEIFPIIDRFVREHPDFTYRGARGTLFFTGFDGICGYRTQSEPVDDREAMLGLDRQAQIRDAKVVIEALREEGWTFGCHGFDHRSMSTLSYEAFCREIDLWREEVGSIVGDTGLFCWPYGDHGGGQLRKGDAHAYAYNSGFYFYFGCGAARYLNNETDGLGIFSDRKGVTGKVLTYICAGHSAYVNNYTYLFDHEAIWDKYRLPYKEWLLERLR